MRSVTDKLLTWYKVLDIDGTKLNTTNVLSLYLGDNSTTTIDTEKFQTKINLLINKYVKLTPLVFIGKSNGEDFTKYLYVYSYGGSDITRQILNICVANKTLNSCQFLNFQNKNLTHLKLAFLTDLIGYGVDNISNTLTDEISRSTNCALLGCISSGKSTLVNSLYMNYFSDTKVLRTTMLPQLYHEKSYIPKTELENVLKINRESNQDILDGKVKLSNETCNEIIHYVPKIDDLVTMPEGFSLSVYDIPGINDTESKDIYFNWINTNFDKFDIIVFLVDITSCMNTSDEKDIIESIAKNIKLEHEKGHDIKLCVLVNKCDDMMLDNEDNLILCEESLVLLKQIRTVIQQVLNNHNLGHISWQMQPISAEDSFVYRMYKKNPTIELDMKHVNKFGYNEVGKNKWNKMNDVERRSNIKELITSGDYTERMKVCGFSQFNDVLSNYLNEENQYKLIAYRLNNYLSKNFNINNYTLFQKHEMTILLEKITYCYNICLPFYNGYNKNLFNLVIKYLGTSLVNSSIRLIQIIEVISSKAQYDIYQEAKESIELFLSKFSKYKLATSKILKSQPILNTSGNHQTSHNIDKYLTEFLEFLIEKQNDYIFKSTSGTLDSLFTALDQLSSNKSDKYFTTILDRFFDLSPTCYNEGYFYRPNISTFLVKLPGDTIDYNASHNFEGLEDNIIDMFETLHKKYKIINYTIIKYLKIWIDKKVDKFNIDSKLNSQNYGYLLVLLMAMEELLMIKREYIMVNTDLQFLMNLKLKVTFIVNVNMPKWLNYSMPKLENWNFYAKKSELKLFNYMLEKMAL